MNSNLQFAKVCEKDYKYKNNVYLYKDRKGVNS